MLAVVGDTDNDDTVFDPPELPLLLETPPHPIPANVKARVELARTEESKKRPVAFIYSLFFRDSVSGSGVH